MSAKPLTDSWPELWSELVINAAEFEVTPEWLLWKKLESERARADAATLAGVKAGIEAAHHEAATITVALSGEQVAERREMMARIRAIDADAVAAQVKP